MDDFDIRLEPRSWTRDEILVRHDELPGRLEVVGGKLCSNEEQRLLLLGALLEHVGIARTLQLGPLKVWAAAIADRQEAADWDNMPAVGNEQFWRPATLRLPFKKRLELRKDFPVSRIKRSTRGRR